MSAADAGPAADPSEPRPPPDEARPSDEIPDHVRWGGPPPAEVRGNDWRSLAVVPLEMFEPSLSTTVVVPYYEAPDELSLTLAGLERQTYPRNLFEVVVVDDGSDPPLELAEPNPLRVRVIHQEDLGFGLARARNNGARAADGDLLAFLDCDMVPEADWLASHARWHHAASDLVTLGFRNHVEVAGIDAAAVRGRPGSLAELFGGRPVQRPEWIERRMSLTDDLASDADDVFRVVTGGNFAVSADFFGAVGGFDESFTQWGSEDIEFGWRAYALGAVLVPERAALCWHQGEGAVLSETEEVSLRQQRDKLSHLVPRPEAAELPAGAVLHGAAVRGDGGAGARRRGPDPRHRRAGPRRRRARPRDVGRGASGGAVRPAAPAARTRPAGPGGARPEQQPRLGRRRRSMCEFPPVPE